MERNRCFDCCYCSEHYPTMKDICDKDEHEIKDVFEFEEVCENYERAEDYQGGIL